jgi:hypothetical protein
MRQPALTDQRLRKSIRDTGASATTTSQASGRILRVRVQLHSRLQENRVTNVFRAQLRSANFLWTCTDLPGDSRRAFLGNCTRCTNLGRSAHSFGGACIRRPSHASLSRLLCNGWFHRSVGASGLWSQLRVLSAPTYSSRSLCPLCSTPSYPRAAS